MDTPICNLSCIGCWCHSPLLGNDKFSGEKKKIHLPTHGILSLLEEAHKLHVHTVQLAGAGEPFLHPDIWEIIRTIKQFRMECRIITNFTLLKDEDIQRLVDLEVDSITASVWAGDEKTYQRTHPGSPNNMFERLEKKLSLLIDSRKCKRLPNLKIYHVVNAENADSINSMVDFAARLGADGVELTMVDIVPGKTDELRPKAAAQEKIAAQFESIRGRPEYTSEFIRTKHLGPFENKIFYDELKEFGRIYPILRGGFLYKPDYNSVQCPMGKWSVKKEISFESGSATYIFERQDCLKCGHKNECWPDGTELGHFLVRPMILLGAGSFLRRLNCSSCEIQAYEAQIIDQLPCTVGWTYARVTVDGKVIPCCKASNFPMGNIHRESFSNIWQSPVYSEFRQKAKTLSKKDPYFGKIKCYRSCDNLGMNLHTYLRLLDYMEK